MKKVVFIISIIICNLAFSQVSTSPTLPTSTSEITILFDAAGTGLDGYTGDVYAHTGVTINNANWQNVIESWGNNTTQPKLTRISGNQYQLLISPDVYSFYNIATSETITGLNFVFRSADGSQQTADLFITLYEEGLNIAFTEPLNGSAYNLNSTITISAEASINADLELFVNGISQKTTTNTNSILTSYKFTSTGTYTLKATATSGSETKETEISVYVKNPTINKTRPIGVKNGFNNNGDGTVTFVLLAPNKTDILLLGDFNNWVVNENYQLYKDGEYFWITLNNLDPNTEYAYQYLIDYTIKIADPYSEKILDPWTDQYIKEGNYPNLKAYPENKTTGYVSTFSINETNYTWNISDFTKPNSENLVIYELLIRDFTESDSYNEALTKLDYLQALGINAIHLMPINEFEGADSWGYNPALYMALDKAYGTKNDFKTFVDACHERGIAVLADVVFNHSFSQSPLLQMYFDSANNKPTTDNPWYNEQSNFSNPDAQWGYDFNHESTYTETFFKDVLSYWMNEYKIDGFRFDFTKGFSNTPYGTSSWGSTYDASRISILKNYAGHVWNNNPTNKPYVIFEHLADNSEETELANYGIMLWGNMNGKYNESTMGWSEGDKEDLSWISYQNRGWNSPNLIGYMESHDEERLMFKNITYGNSTNLNYNVKDLNIALARQELAGMFFYTIPGPKLIWQFGELGYEISIDENGRTGRKPVPWDYLDNLNRMHLYSTWATLMAFKQQQPVFNTSNFTLNVTSLLKSVILRDATMDVVVLGNFEVENKEISIEFTKTGIWYEYFTGKELNITNTSQTIQLKPGEYQLYSSVKLLDPRGGTATDDSDNDGINDSIDLCPNTMEGVAVSATGCPTFSMASNNFKIEAIGETCPDKDNGQILITAVENYNYSTTIKGTTYNFTSSTGLMVENLAPATYNFCITIEGETFEQCYSLTIEEGAVISGKASLSSRTANIEITKGTAPFDVFINNKPVFKTYSPSFVVDVQQGDIIEVKTAVTCEGIFSKQIDLFDKIIAFPNPTQGLFEIALPILKDEVIVEIYNFQSQLISLKSYPVFYEKVQINLANNPTGLYFAKVYLEDKPIVLKILKY